LKNTESLVYIRKQDIYNGYSRITLPYIITVHWPRPLLQVLNKVSAVDGSISTRYILLVRDMTFSIHEATTHYLSFLQEELCIRLTLHSYRPMWQIFLSKNILSCGKQEVDMRQIRNYLIRYSSPYWCSVPDIRKLTCLVPKKMWQKLLCDKFFYIKNNVSSVKQEVDMRQIRNCLTRYSSPYWCSVSNIKKLACVVPEKNVTEIILWRWRRRIVIPICRLCVTQATQ